MTLALKQFDTFPAWVLALMDDDGPINISSAASVKLVLKLVGGSTVIGPVATTPIAEASFTASMTVNSVTLTGVSSFAGIFENSSITGNGIPTGTLVVKMDTSAATITMSNPATRTSAAVALIANRGMVSYMPTATDTAVAGSYAAECSIHWDVPGVQIQKVPNLASANPIIQIDPDLLGATE